MVLLKLIVWRASLYFTGKINSVSSSLKNNSILFLKIRSILNSTLSLLSVVSELFLNKIIAVSTAASKTLSLNKQICKTFAFSYIYFLIYLYSVFENKPSGCMKQRHPFSFNNLCPFSKKIVNKLNLPLAVRYVCNLPQKQEHLKI